MQDELLSKATETLGSAKQAEKWMRKPNPHFQGRAPRKLLDSPQGRDKVHLTLDRMQQRGVVR